MCRFCSAHASLVYVFDTIEREFGAEKIVRKFAEAVAKNEGEEVETVAKRTFGEYGKDLMKRTIELGEKSKDETYEKLEGNLPEWFIEVAYISIQPLFFQLNVVEYNQHRFVFRIDNCHIFNALKRKCRDEIANQMPCKHACLTFSETAYRDLGRKATVSMDASMMKNGYCQFTANNLALQT